MAMWACIFAAGTTIVIGFGWGGWVTAGTARKMAMAAGDVARTELASTICVERFKAEPNRDGRLNEFNALAEPNKKQKFVETNGWATRPGEKYPDRMVTESCAAALSALVYF
jgi:hypothetical protein